MNKKLLLTVNEAAEFVGIGRNTLRVLIAWDKLSTVRVGKKILIRTEVLEEFIRLNDGHDLKNRYEVIAV